MCQCRQYHSVCTCSIKLEVGKKYRARSGTIYEVVAESKGRFIVTHGRQPEHSLAWRYSNGKFHESSATIAPSDLVEEVKEPRTFKVYVYEFYDGSIGVFKNKPSLGHRPPMILAIKTITEGEGRDSNGHWIGEVGGET